jgi:hypothetical protein
MNTKRYRRMSCLIAAITIMVAVIAGFRTKNGYHSSAEIEAASLVAFWSFNGTLVDSVGGLATVGKGSGYSVGRLPGTKAYQGSGSGYSYAMSTNAGPSLPALRSFTLSVWLNAQQPLVNNNEALIPGLGEQAIFQLVNDSSWQPNVHLGLTPFRSADPGIGWPNSDTLMLKLILSNYPGGKGIPYGQYYLTAFLDKAVAKWTHVVVTYDAFHSTVNVYENGAVVPVSGPYTNYPGYVGLELFQSDPGGPAGSPNSNPNGAKPWGDLSFKNVSGICLGGWGVNTSPLLSVGRSEPWMGHYTGAMERLRIYNTPLSAEEVKSLYTLENLGQ